MHEYTQYKNPIIFSCYIVFITVDLRGTYLMIYEQEDRQEDKQRVTDVQSYMHVIWPSRFWLLSLSWGYCCIWTEAKRWRQIQQFSDWKIVPSSVCTVVLFWSLVYTVCMSCMNQDRLQAAVFIVMVAVSQPILQLNTASQSLFLVDLGDACDICTCNYRTCRNRSK